MNLRSKELFINLKDKDIPYWNPLYDFEEQDDDVKQFWDNEALKLTEGVTINGVFIHPWLYWHLNFWKMMLDKGDDRVPGLSELRDNEWFFTEILSQAERENKGIFMFGTRRFGKALLDSEILYLENGEKRIGDVVIGDKIYDDSGSLAEVTGIYPQGVVKTYKICFEDGRNVICCGKHLWKVKISGKWNIKTLGEIASMDSKNMKIPLSKGLNYKYRKLPMHPSMYGSLIASYLEGFPGEIPFDNRLCREFLRASLSQKEDFINSFIKSFKGVVTGEEEIEIAVNDSKVVNFVLRMFWSYGWFAKMNGPVMILSANKKEVAISGIELQGRHRATCITVDNNSHLFLTTNYIVTHNTAVMSSLVGRNATMTYNLVHTVTGSSREDLMSLGEYLEFGLDHVPPYLKINRTSNDWSKEVTLGVKNVRNERDVHARIRITNIDQGKSAASLKTAGGTPYTTIYDEVGKFPFLAAYLQGLPAQRMQGRMRGMIIASGCVCGGTKVYVEGNKVKNIEDVVTTDSLLGYSRVDNNLKYLDIEWMKRPSKKACYKVKAKRGDREYSLDCSYDHPFFCYTPKHRDNLYTDYVQAIELIAGDEVGVYCEGGIKKAVVESIEYIGPRTVYNVHTKEFNNYIANDFLTHNTGGNVERSQDAQKVMNDPSAYDFIVMDYDILNKHVVSPTWTIRKSGCFVPGQMSHAFKKDKTTLDKYLGISNAPGLKKIGIQVTNFERSTEEIKAKREALAKKDKELYVSDKMSYPLNPDDCFLNSNVNRFPVDDAQIHKNRLLEGDRIGKAVDIYKMAGNKMGWNFSNKLIAPYPFKGGNIDSPVIIYEDPPEDGGNLGDYIYTSGCLPPGSIVLTERGWKNIENVTLNDRLVDMHGTYVDIDCFMMFAKKNSEIFDVTMYNTYRKTSFTGEHPLYISRNISKHGYSLNENNFDFNFVEMRDVKVGDWTRIPNVYSREEDCTGNMNGFKCTYDFWWFIGLWLGDGSFGRDFVCITVSNNEKFISDRLVDFVRRELGIEPGFTDYGTRSNIYIRSKKLLSWIERNFGRHSDGKFIPEWVKFIKHEYKLSLIHGYLDSDGCINIDKKGHINSEFVSINLGLLEAFQSILFSIGIISSVSKLRDAKKMVIEGRTVDAKKCYRLRIGNYYTIRLREGIEGIFNGKDDKIDKSYNGSKKAVMKKCGCFFSKDMKYIYIQIQKIEEKPYDGLVYNLCCTNHNYMCMNLQVSNCDPFKQDKASTDSVGAFYVFKRHVRINDPYANKIVASYCSRPPKSDDFCRNCETLIEAYGAKCLMENADRIFELYLARRNKDVVLLEDGEKLANRIIRPGARQNNRLGLSPTVPNQRMLINEVLQYCWEDIVIGYDDDGNEIKEKGIYRIDDIELLDEIIAFGPNVNTDRIIAFGHALLLAKYYDDMNFTSRSLADRQNEVTRENRRIMQNRGFTFRRHNPFRIR